MRWELMNMMNDEYCNHDSEKEDYDCEKSL